MRNSISNNNEKLNVKSIKTEIMSTKTTNKNLVNNSNQQNINKIYTEKEMISFLENEKEDIKEYYPIPNLFFGWSYERSIEELNKILNEIDNKIKEVKSGKFNK